MCNYEEAFLRIAIIVINKTKNKYNNYDYLHLWKQKSHTCNKQKQQCKMKMFTSFSHISRILEEAMYTWAKNYVAKGVI